MPTSKNRVLYFTVVIVTLAIMFFLPTQVSADSDIRVRICDPERLYDASDEQEGNTLNKVLSSPTVSYGENRELGTVQITGKAGIVLPLAKGQKIMLLLPEGSSFMQIPDESNYRCYVEWPEQFEGKKNQISDYAGQPGIKFIDSSPRSLTIELNHVDCQGEIMVINFLFDRDNYSKTRIASFIEVAEEYLKDGEGKISRREYFTHIAQLAGPFAASPLNEFKGDKIAPADIFADVAEDQTEIDKIIPLIERGLVQGYAEGLLRPEEDISRAEAAHLAGRLFGIDTAMSAAFSDDIPDWAEKGINKAFAAGIVRGYTDGTFQANRPLSKSEAITILQNCLESYSMR